MTITLNIWLSDKLKYPKQSDITIRFRDIGVWSLTKLVTYFEIENNSGYEKTRKVFNGKIYDDWILAKLANDGKNVRSSPLVKLTDLSSNSIAASAIPSETLMLHFIQLCLNECYIRNLRKYNIFRGLQFPNIKFLRPWFCSLSIQDHPFDQVTHKSARMRCDVGKVKKDLIKGFELPHHRSWHSALDPQSEQDFLHGFNSTLKEYVSYTYKYSSLSCITI
jgi:hypothetical protein